MSKPGPNLRFELRAYEATDACRLASVLQELTSEQTPGASRNAVAARWAERYPRHAFRYVKKNIRSRISSGLTLLRVARIVQSNDNNIVVISWQRLRLAAENLAVVEDTEGVAIRPALWARRPVVPEHLKEVQDELEQSRRAAADTSPEA